MRELLNRLRDAARRNDWHAIGELFIEVQLEEGSAKLDAFYFNEIADAIRYRDTERLTSAVDGLTKGVGGRKT